ncbi:hypothetical protein VTN00DRAFT_9486 [Thermoascus crustaceus]|uniref:uncharacterized protein n=1 Tax=Thermoascus crustaceus TaxID=5088 RepID=UPI0037426B7C
MSFSPSQWAQRRRQGASQRQFTETCTQVEGERDGSSRNSSLVSTSTVRIPAEDDWIEVASMFQAATLLYCTETLVVDRSMPNIVSLPSSRIDVQALRSATMDTLFKGLRGLVSGDKRKGAWLGKFMFWPLFIAGMACCNGSEKTNERRFVTNSLCDLSHFLGGLSAIDAASFLQAVWQMDASSGAIHLSWDERVAVLGTHGLFFI